ncbi:reverse transcriptase domain-containing protein [Tanacetum coccineum]
MSVRLADRSFQYPVGIAKNMLIEVVKQKQLNLRVGTERMIYNIDFAMKHSYSNDDTCFSIDVIDEILEEEFDALLDEGSKILHSIEGTLLEEEIFSEFDEFMAMTANENSESESDTEEPPFEKITINTDYKIKTSLEEPPTDLELKPLPDNLEYVFLKEPSFLPVIISSKLSAQKSKLISVFKKHKEAFAWKTTDIPGIRPSFCKHKIQLLDDKKPLVQKQRRLNLNMQEVVKKEIMKLLDTGIIYPIADSPWVSPIHCVPKNRYGLARNKYLCFLDGFSGYFQNPIDAMDQEKTTFTCPSNITPIGVAFCAYCTLQGTFQRCMLAICHDMIEESVEVFMDDFSIFGDSFDKCLNNLDKILQRCKDAHLVLNWEKCHFMVKEGIVLGHKVSSVGLEVDKAKNQQFDIEIKDRKGTENVTADHLSRIENDQSGDDSEVDDNFPRETFMEVNTKDEPWFADFANYLVADIIPKRMTYQQKNKFFSDLKHYFLEEPHLFKVCSDGMIRRCVSGPETQTILDQCHHEPTGGHYGPNVTAKKVLDSGFYWPTIIKEAHTLV